VTSEALLAVVLVTALFFAWTNGVHDAANAVATPLSTRVLTPRVALGLAAVLNVLGAMLGEGVARTIGIRLLTPPTDHPGLGIVLSGLVGAIAWNLFTLQRGVPSSSSHALVGGLAGAALAASTTVDGAVLFTHVLVPMVFSPVVGFFGAWLLMALLFRVFRDATYRRAIRRFRIAQAVSASAMALGHGLQDGQKTMGVMMLALFAAERDVDGSVPVWVRLSAAMALGLGTYAGGWRIIRTLGRRVVHVDPVTGFAAETVASGLLYTTAYVFNVPVSSTHTVTASIAGAGTSLTGLRAVRWRVLRPIVAAWVVTLPAAGAVSAGCYLLGTLLAG
jgi:PiT family inorganic phosphate transporter